MRDENYITMQWWMVDKLNLKNTELMIYAIIHGFSQEENSEFTGSLNYLEQWTKSSKKTVIETLKKLVDKDLITKTEINKNGVKFCKYKTKMGGVKITPGVVKKLHQGGEKITPNNIEDINSYVNICINRGKNKKFIKPTIEEIKAYCKERKNNVDAEVFYDFYESKGWVVGKSSMKNWKAAVRTWEKNKINNSTPNPKKETTHQYMTIEEVMKEEEETQKRIQEVIENNERIKKQQMMKGLEDW